MAGTLSPANTNSDSESPGPRTKVSITRLKRSDSSGITATRPTIRGLVQEDVSGSICTPLCHNKSNTIACKAAATSVLLKTERGKELNRRAISNHQVLQFYAAARVTARDTSRPAGSPSEFGRDNYSRMSNASGNRSAQRQTT